MMVSESLGFIITATDRSPISVSIISLSFMTLCLMYHCDSVRVLHGNFSLFLCSLRLDALIPLLLLIRTVS